MQKYWNIFATVITLLSLSSLIDNLVQWTGIFELAISTYQGVVYPIAEIVAGHLQVEVNHNITNQYVISLFLTKALISTITKISILEYKSSVLGRLVPHQQITLPRFLIINLVVIPIVSALLIFIWSVAISYVVARTMYLFINTRKYLINSPDLSNLSFSDHVQYVENMRSAARKRNAIKSRCDVENKESLNELLKINKQHIQGLRNTINTLEDKQGRYEILYISSKSQLDFLEEMNKAIPFTKTDSEIFKIGKVNELRKIIYFVKHIVIVAALLLALILVNHYSNQLILLPQYMW